MKEIIQTYLPWVMSCITIYTMFLAGNRTRAAWVIGLANQVLWFIYIFTIQAWGLLPMTIALCFTYTRNYLLWKNPNKPYKPTP